MTRAILLHGFAADRMTWAGTVPGLRGISAETYDLPGHGAALETVGTGDLQALSAPCSTHLTEGDPAWIVGHSLGGAVAMRLALEHPEHVLGLVLIAPLGLAVDVDFEEIGSVTRVTEQSEMQAFLERLVANPALIAPMVATYALGQLEREGARAALQRVAEALPSTRDAALADVEALTASGMPVTTLWGAHDQIARPDMSKINALGEFVEVEGTGHIPHVEAVKTVNTLIRDCILK